MNHNFAGSTRVYYSAKTDVDQYFKTNRGHKTMTIEADVTCMFATEDYCLFGQQDGKIHITKEKDDNVVHVMTAHTEQDIPGGTEVRPIRSMYAVVEQDNLLVFVGASFPSMNNNANLDSFQSMGKCSIEITIRWLMSLYIYSYCINPSERTQTKPHYDMQSHKGAVHCVHYYAGTVYSGGADGAIKIWELDNFLVRWTRFMDHSFDFVEKRETKQRFVSLFATKSKEWSM